MSRYNRCKECYNMKCIFVTGERTDFDSSECADFRSMTNADRIRSMTDEQLAEFIEHSPYPPNATCSEEGCKFDTCVDCWLDWLKQEAE